jgi:hypothetical protein
MKNLAVGIEKFLLISGLEVRVLPGSPFQTKHLIRSWVPPKKASPGTFPGCHRGGLHGASSVRLAIKRVFEHAPRLYLEPEMKFRCYSLVIEIHHEAGEATKVVAK